LGDTERAESMAKAAVLAEVCAALALGEVGKASAIAGEKCPFLPRQSAGRRSTKSQSTEIFTRDCFIDRYSGERLVFPATLRLLGSAPPDWFPFHPNWKMSESHTAYWELFSTVDHVGPVARGGVDDETDWVSTSMIRNSAKSGWLLEELGWRLQEPGNLDEWDGLTSWFLDYCDNHPSVMEHQYLASWHRVARQTMGIA
jgi:hypothetical protein